MSFGLQLSTITLTYSTTVTHNTLANPRWDDKYFIRSFVVSFLSSSPPQNDFIPAVASPTRGVWYLPHLYHTDRIGSDEQIVSTVASSTFLFLHLHCHSWWLARGNAPTMNLLPVTQTRLHSHLCSPLVSRVHLVTKTSQRRRPLRHGRESWGSPALPVGPSRTNFVEGARPRLVSTVALDTAARTFNS